MRYNFLASCAAFSLCASGLAQAQTNANDPTELRFYNNSSSLNWSNLTVASFNSGGNVTYGATTNSAATWTNNSSLTLDLLPSGTSARGEYKYAYVYNNASAAWVVGVNAPYWSATNTGQPSPTGSIWQSNSFSQFEMTVDGNAADKGDITSISVFSIPMVMRTYSNYAATTMTAISGYTNAAAASTLKTQLVNAFPFATTYSGTGAGATPLNVIGANMGIAPGQTIVKPGESVGYPMFTNYVAAVKANTNRVTKIADNTIAYQNPGSGGTNWFYMYDFNMTVETNNSIKLVGSITASNSTGTLNMATYSNLVMTIAADGTNYDDAPLSSYIYQAPGQTTNTPWANYVGFTNTGSQTWQDLINHTGIDPTTFNATIQGRIGGDVAAGFALGFINSDTIDPLTGEEFGDLASGQWWDSTNQLLAYDALQTNSSYYSQYGALIWNATRLTYAHPIGDRLQAYQVQIDVARPPTYVVEVGIGDPLSVVPELASAVYISLAIFGFAGFMAVRKRFGKKAGA